VTEKVGRKGSSDRHGGGKVGAKGIQAIKKAGGAKGKGTIGREKAEEGRISNVRREGSLGYKNGWDFKKEDWDPEKKITHGGGRLCGQGGCFEVPNASMTGGSRGGGAPFRGDHEKYKVKTRIGCMIAVNKLIRRTGTGSAGTRHSKD